jgi:ABC-2 type transport system ATP-binding protein
MSAIIGAKELSCFYGIVLGLNNVTFEIEPGITGLVGPNGAGKSTLIKLITGQLSPSSGALTVFGQSPLNNPDLLARIGYCPEREQVSKELKPLDWLRGLASLSGIPWRNTKSVAQRALSRAQLDPKHWEKRLGTYSKGMKQRVKLAQAIMHDPDLIVLDEPMNGLDPNGRSEFCDILKELHNQGKSILVSSHILHELEFLCSRFLILNWGRALASGSQSEIRNTVTEWSDELTIRCSDPKNLADHLEGQGLIRGYLVENGTLKLWVLNPETFFDNWPSFVSGSDVEIFEIKNSNQALTSLFDKMTK